MQSPLEFYLQQQTLIPRFPSLEGLYSEAIEKLKTQGFPTRADEDWKYSSTVDFCSMRFSLDEAWDDACLDSESNIFSSLPTYSMSGTCLQESVFPEGVIVASWSDALAHHAEKIAPFLGKILKTEHGFHAQNTAMLSKGLFIYIPKSLILDTPLRLMSHQNHAHARYIRHLVVLEEGASMCMIEDYHGGNDVAYYTNTVTEIYLHKRASLQHYKIQCEGQKAYHVGQLAVAQQEHSSFESHSFALGGAWVRSDIEVQLEAPHSTCLMNGIYMTENKQHLDHHTKVHHHVPYCTSQQDYKGLVAGASRFVFNGIVDVRPFAIGTVAHQTNKNLLLSRSAEVDTKPQLEIDADDVICTHGATVGQLDEDALFYLETRGVPVDEARYLLMRAFVEENLQKMGRPEWSHWMSHLLNPKMEF